MKTLTRKHFDRFKECCKKWLKFFGLNTEWDIYYAFLKGDKETAAGCKWNIEAKAVTLALYNPWSNNNDNLPEKDMNELLDEYALHEVLELLLCPLVCVAESRSFDTCMAESIRHGIINKLLYTYMKHPAVRITHEK